MMPPWNRWAFTVMTISRALTLVPCFVTPNPAVFLGFIHKAVLFITVT